MLAMLTTMIVFSAILSFVMAIVINPLFMGLVLINCVLMIVLANKQCYGG